MKATILGTLEEIRRLSTFRFARFRDADGKDISDSIAEVTSLYRETWLLPLIDELIAREKRKREKRRERKAAR